jgi:hypothetical protein
MRLLPHRMPVPPYRQLQHQLQHLGCPHVCCISGVGFEVRVRLALTRHSSRSLPHLLRRQLQRLHPPPACGGGRRRPAHSRRSDSACHELSCPSNLCNLCNLSTLAAKPPQQVRGRRACLRAVRARWSGSSDVRKFGFRGLGVGGLECGVWGLGGFGM